MKAMVYAEDMDEKRRYVDTIIYDNTLRAIQMYGDECDDEEQIVLIDVED